MRVWEKKVAMAEDGMESQGFEAGCDLGGCSSYPQCFKPKFILEMRFW